eukprot:6497106-Lingulodinium_polyedra.AAC.1
MGGAGSRGKLFSFGARPQRAAGSQLRDSKRQSRRNAKHAPNADRAPKENNFPLLPAPPIHRPPRCPR